MNELMIKIIFLGLGLLFGVFLGFYIYPRYIMKPEGKILFFLQQYDDDTNVVNCSIKPDKDWGNYLNRHRIIFSISKTPELQEALKNNIENIEKEN